MSPWTPPGVDPVEHAALVSGVPAWIQIPVSEWVSRQIGSMNGIIRDDFLAAWDIGMRNNPPHLQLFSGRYPKYFWDQLDSAEQVALLDLLVLNTQDEAKREALENVLRAGGSEWRVGLRAGNPGLENRVPQGVADAADGIIGTSATAGALLSEAWHAAYGRNPDPEEAYEKAIKAVEEAGTGVVSPKNVRASLGTMARDMENQKDWTLPLGEDAAHPSADVVYRMVQSLWAGQESRHGGNAYRKPTHAEAEAAVLLAVPLVQFFTAGLVARVAP